MTVYLVRHASAGLRNGGDPHDAQRRLDEAGRHQAELLVAHLAGADIRRVLSSPALRCVETVEPVAALASLDVERHPALFEGSDLDLSWAVLEKCARAEGDSVLCSHGDVIPELIRRAQLRGMEVPGRTGSSKGSCWNLEWDGERFVRGTYTPLKAK